VANIFFWDGGTTNIAGNGNVVSAGGSGTWNTTTSNWDIGFAPHTAWGNTTADKAIFGGAAGTVTLAADMNIGELLFSVVDAGGTGYFIGNATEDNTLTFGGNKKITLNRTGNNSNQDATIRAGIAGSPALDVDARASASAFFALEPPSGITMTLGTLNMKNNYASDKQLRLGGQSTSNVVDLVTWPATGNQLQVRKQDSTSGGANGSSWTINQNISLNAGRIYVDEGTLILSGTNNWMSHSVQVESGGRIVLKGNWRINDEDEDFRVLSGGIVSPGEGIATATFNWNSSRADPSVGLVDLQAGSTYEWELGAGSNDVIAITEPVANGNAQLVVASGSKLKVIDAGGSPKVTDQLTVFTYGAGVVTPDTATLNANMTIDTSGTTFTVGTPTLVNDGAGTIYLTGMGKAGVTLFMFW